jgi:hypothetical protein
MTTEGSTAATMGGGGGGRGASGGGWRILEAPGAGGFYGAFLRSISSASCSSASE